MPARKKQNEAAAEVAANARQSGSDRLTVEAILQVLEQDGIRDLQQFVKHLLARTAASRKALGRASLLGPASSKPSQARGKAQRPVTVPVLIDGVLYDPKDIHRFDGQILHFVGPSATRKTLQAFTGEQWPTILRTYVQLNNAGSILHWKDIIEGGGAENVTPSTPGQAAGESGSGVVVEPSSASAGFFSDSNFGGDYLWLSRGNEWRDLTKVMRGDAWDRHSWNDTISSVSPIVGWGLVVLCDDINLGGASLSIPAPVRDLTPFGFNDRTSSIVYW
jgi:hypothetical protein